MTDEDIDDLGIERQKLFARDLSGHPAEALIASTVRIEGKRSDGKTVVGTGFLCTTSYSAKLMSSQIGVLLQLSLIFMWSKRWCLDIFPSMK
jgi:hypothetical protein